ncbi:MAG TPA: hypothetical protein DEA40_05645, partial [Parvularcula sp.]|nr:hypothetical protein [Parvularcula sp.]
EAVARRYLSITRARGVFFLVAGDEDLADRIGADGVHWPSGGHRESGTGNGVRRHSRFPIPDSRLLVTAAAHDAAELAAAAAGGTKLALLSPAFATRSHPGTEHLGAARFKALAAASPIPVLALGGVEAGNAAFLKGRNICGIAAIGAFFSSLDESAGRKSGHRSCASSFASPLRGGRKSPLRLSGGGAHFHRGISSG